MNNDDMKYILTIDMGTTAFKAAVFDCEGREAGSATDAPARMGGNGR